MSHAIQKTELNIAANLIAGNRGLHVFILALGCKQLAQGDLDFMFAPSSFSPPVGSFWARHARWPLLFQLLEIGVPFIKRRNNNVQFPINRLRFSALTPSFKVF
jgi:hypothetical protein